MAELVDALDFGSSGVTRGLSLSSRTIFNQRIFMKVSIESTQGLENTKNSDSVLNIEAKVSERLQKAAKTVALKGFRKGKVPVRVVQQHFGRGIRQEIVGEAINTGYDAISKEKLNPVGQPKLDILEDKKGVIWNLLRHLKCCQPKVV